MTDAAPPAPAAPAAAPAATMKLRLRRDTSAVGAWLANAWARRWFRWATTGALAALALALLVWATLIRTLPSASLLLEYESRLPSIVRDATGDPVHSYARERRVQLEFAEYPQLLVRAYLAAEDKNFFAHGGLDYFGLARALAQGVMSGTTPRGTSTITQQVAKNLLLTNEVTYTRKLREAFLAFRIEDVLEKEQILELYLNEIPLGRRSFGVQAAARAYFDRDVENLRLHEMAFLAALPKSPETLGRARFADRAVERRNYVLGQMLENGWITRAQHDAARALPLGIVPQRGNIFPQVGGYYMEEVRRQLADQFGETAKDGSKHSVYEGGLWVRTAFDAGMQDGARRALRAGFQRYDAGKGWSGPVATIPMDGQWQSRLASSFVDVDYEDWRVAVVVSKAGTLAALGFANGDTGTLAAGLATLPYRKAGTSAFAALRPGDLIVVKPQGGDRYALRNVPEVSGGMVVQNVHSGRIHAMQGGFDVNLSAFNRATQAERQPGSTIKPFVYAAALDNGMTPATLILDGTFCVYQGARFGRKCFRNFGGGGGSGEQTMRWGLEQSRNLMTVRAASQVGMEPVVDMIRKAGIGQHEPFLATALGSGSTSVARITNAYATLANHGRDMGPRIIDYVQDRRGKVILPVNYKPCPRCNMADWDGKPFPRAAAAGRQVVDPVTAFQMVHVLEGVIQRGTATNLRDLGVPIFGKTGTTTGPKDVWFVGGTPDIVAGLYLGFDTPRNMGSYAQGGSLAAPIFRQFVQTAMPDRQPIPFAAPRGVRMVRIDRRTGRRVFGGWPGDDPKSGVIWEAFKADSEPRRTIAAPSEAVPRRAAPKAAATDAPAERAAPPPTRSDSEFMDDRGGII